MTVNALGLKPVYSRPNDFYLIAIISKPSLQISLICPAVRSFLFNVMISFVLRFLKTYSFMFLSSLSYLEGRGFLPVPYLMYNGLTMDVLKSSEVSIFSSSMIFLIFGFCKSSNTFSFTTYSFSCSL